VADAIEQQFRLSRLAVRLGTFTEGELQEITGLPTNAISGFVSGLAEAGGLLERKPLKTADDKDQPCMVYTVTPHGVDHLLRQNAQIAADLRAACGAVIAA
jgi:hypothetical protein